jgi:branched-chain amino acid transport system ATP-binding protein
MLEVKNIETYYGHVMAIKGISIKVPQGAIVCVLGANGAGKSTLLKTISGILSGQPEKGTIEFMGLRIDGIEPHRIVELGISHVPEGREIFGQLSVEENLRLGTYRIRKKGRDEWKKALRLFPFIEERLNQRADTLSGGEQQILAILRALMGKPKLLMMDEPSLGLSPLFIREVGRIIREINSEGVTVLLVEQNARLALSLSNYGYILENGRIVMKGEAHALMNDDDVVEFYLGMKEYTKVKSYKRQRRWV